LALKLKLTACAALLFAASPANTQTPVYQNPAAPIDKRVDDLVSRMTLEEKISQLMNDSAPIDRLGVPPYNWWNECLHGVARAGRATVFPEAIGLAATWDTGLLFRVAAAISDEARAKHHEFVRRGKRNIYQGLTFWTPNINLFRDPRWGRGMETYGEDPFLTGRMAVEFIKGLQGNDPKYFKTIATAKHYAVHSGPESERHTFDAVVSEQDLRETYLAQFEMAIKDGGAYSVMCAYNRIDGLPACASPRLLEDILRKEWGFNGYVVSDCGAVGDIYRGHKTSPDAPAGTAAALKAGTDLACGTEYTNLVPAVKQGLASEADINLAVRRLFLARFKLGLFDPPEMLKYSQIPYNVNDSEAHRKLAVETARKSIVLLKNDAHTLPLSKSLKTIAVIGPNANDAEVMVGNYNGDPTSPVTPLEGIRQKVGANTKVLYTRGSDLAANLPIFEVVPATALTGLKGEYYNSANFDGVNHRQRGRNAGSIPQNLAPLFTRADATIDFKWWDGSPRADLNDDDFGIRWTGSLSAPVTGTYQLGAIGMNAFELYLDDKPLVRFNNIHERSYQYQSVDLQAGKQYAIRLDYHEFMNDADIQLVWSRPHPTQSPDVDAVVKQADAVVLVLGLSPRLEGEEMKVPVEGFKGGDRVDLGIPKAQEELMQKVVASGKPVVLVLLNGSAVAVNWARDHVPAIVELWYPGQAGGTALADVLFGDYNPAGRLPVTFYKSADQLPPFTDYNMKGRTYRYFKDEPLFPFGHGLSYTTFAYRNLKLPKQINVGEEAKVSVEVENTGKAAGDEVVQLYVKSTTAGPSTPIRSLEGFSRISLAPGERKSVQFVLTPRQFSAIRNDGKRVITAGSLQVSVGGKQPGFQGPSDASTPSVVSGTMRLEGTSKEIN